MLDLLKVLLSSAMAGGATGLLGALFSTWGELAKMKELHRHEEIGRQLDLQVAQVEAEGKMVIARTEAEATIAVSTASLQAASMAADRATYAVGDHPSRWLIIVDFLRGIVRPIETLYFTGLLTYVSYRAFLMFDSMSQFNQSTVVSQLVPEVISTVLYLSTTIILWWFGVRQKSK